MAGMKIPDLDEILGADVEPADKFVLVDVDDLAMDPTGTNKYIIPSELLIALGALPKAGGTMTGPLTSTFGTVTVNTPALSATQTWNDAGVTFYGILQNITNTAQAAASRLIALQSGGSNRFSVDKDGTATLGPGGSTALGALHVGFHPSSVDFVKFGGNANFGFNFYNTDGNAYFVWNGAAEIQFSGASQGSVGFKTNGLITWTSSSSILGTIDVCIGRNAAGVVEINNGTAGTFRDLKCRNLIGTGYLTLDGTSVTGSAGTVSLGGVVRTTIGANGGASALTALPAGYIDAYVGSTAVQIPYYLRGS